MRKERCEACHTNVRGDVTLLWHLWREDVEYTLCTGCLPALLSLSLNPTQFHCLVASGHSVKEFLLHRDFYDEDGFRLYPAELREDASLVDIAEALRVVALATVFRVADDLHVGRSASGGSEETYFRRACWLDALDKLSRRLEASLGLSDGKTAGGVIDPGADVEE